jgi:Leucine-rich repeat (LRR) protein
LQLSKDVFPAALSNLETLSLDGCQISRLGDDIFERLTSLKVLSLRNNPIYYIPKAINAIPNLAGLDLSGTEITELQTDQISADHNLNEIRLTNMTYLYGIYDCAFCGLPNLKIVDLSNNSQLYAIHENAFGSIINKKYPQFPIATLKEFDIRYCNFSNLPEKLFDWTKIESLKINGNPFNCNTDLEWLTKNKNIHFETNPKCAKPLSLKGMYFSNITKSVLQTYLHGFFTLKGVIALSLTVIGFTALSASAYILHKILYNRIPSRTRGPQYTVLPTKV